jgi:lipoprotein-anchoring transpeptidase ErfK/SrfK
MSRGRLIDAALALVVVLVAGVGVVAYDHSFRGRIAPGVTAAGVDVGGLTPAEARAKLASAVARPLQQSLVLRHGTDGFTLDPRAAHVHADVDALVDAAYARSRSGFVLGRAWREFRGERLKVDVPMRITWSAPALARYVAHLAKTIDRAPRNASVTPSRNGLAIVRDRTGESVRQVLLRRRLVAALQADVNRPRIVDVPTRTLRPRTTYAALARRYAAYIIVDRRSYELQLYVHLHPAHTYSVSVGKAGLETPAGLYDVQWKEVNPPWRVPKSSWAGPLAGQVIPPGPRDPIKARWLAFNGSAGIHGTDETWSIGHAASHGCIRMRIPDVEQLYSLTPVHSPVFVA